MQPKVGNTVYGADGSSYRLGQEIGKGGQGSVWSVFGDANLVAKFYHAGFSSTDLKKIGAMCRLKTDALNSVAAWPLTLLKETKTGDPQGVLMRRISGYQSVHQLYGLKSRLRLFPEAQFPFLLHTAINTARGFATIHDAGQVVGDVNHSNLMISQNATVAMIDCDSFQIRDGKTVFLCPVGVPDFTPPELQGKSFSAQERTTQHDAFGLSVLIFQLLFLGRHPFMGSFDPSTGEVRSLDQAIAEYRFPYALPLQSPEARLPGYLPRLADFTDQIGYFFKRAFTRESLTRGRPTPHEWVNALSSLAGALKQCRTNGNHHYFSGAAECPWCRAEGAIGAAVFGIKVTIVADTSFNLVTVWASIDAIGPIPERLAMPDLQSLAAQVAMTSSIPGVIKKRRTLRVTSMCVLLALPLIAYLLFNALGVVLSLVVGTLIARALWNRGAAPARPFKEEYDTAKDRYEIAHSDFERSSDVPSVFFSERRQLEGAKEAYESLAPQKAKRLAALNDSRKQKQLQHFLERFRLEDERVPLIGDKNKLILYTEGILDAADVDYRRLTGIKYFGPKKVQALMEWRASKERLFRFDPTQPIDPRDLLALEQEFAQRASVLRSTLTGGPQKLQQVMAVWNAQRRQSFTALTIAASRLAQAQADYRALRVF